MIEKTLGGERVGSGNKMKVRMHNFERSTHNLSQGWKSPMQIGVLYPFLVLPTMRGDKFDIDLGAAVRTTPTYGALFGSYKLQLDVYQCPVRLYTGILHNNPMNIGLKMAQVKFPKIEMTAPLTETNVKCTNNCLLKYLGLSGLGHKGRYVAKRTFNAIPMLAYYDIFKNYYANKQEEYAYIYSNTEVDILPEIETCEILPAETSVTVERVNNMDILRIETEDENDQIFITFDDTFYSNLSEIEEQTKIIVKDKNNNNELLYNGTLKSLPNTLFTKDNDGDMEYYLNQVYESALNVYIEYEYKKGQDVGTGIYPFKLKNIDQMRMDLLSWHTMGAAYTINEETYAPYGNNVYDAFNEMGGLVLKTYQSDIFNNWLDKELIEGENGIANITRVDAQGGSFTIDALNYAEKLYDLLNRVAVAGNTYEDYQDVVWEQVTKRQIESPIYLGGLSQEIVFEEVISSSATADGKLGQIGGRGISRHRKGGHISVKIDEASFIIGIVSITPRINYSQGNEFYLTDIESLEDFHKPSLDGIGFQDLIGERMAYFDTHIKSGTDNIIRHSIGKQPAWLQYMTAVDKVFGYFAAGESGEYMVLDRDYQVDDGGTGGIADATTYIDPTKYNYVFADQSVTAQNFWVQIQSDIKARRKMSAKLMPNI